MFDYSPINTYPCTPPGAATNIKKNLERSMDELRMLLQRKNSVREEVRKYFHRNSNVFL